MPIQSTPVSVALRELTAKAALVERVDRTALVNSPSIKTRRIHGELAYRTNISDSPLTHSNRRMSIGIAPHRSS
jgi:hypothetical protein